MPRATIDPVTRIEGSPEFGSFAPATVGRRRCSAGGTVPASLLDHLLAHLTLKFLCLTAEFIKLVENRLQFFRR